MDQERYRALVEEKQLYTPIFIRKFGMESPHWKNESWYKRELSLRHDMCCVLLCNLQMSEVTGELLSSNEGEVVHQEEREEVEPIDPSEAEQEDIIEEVAQDFEEEHEKIVSDTIMRMEEKHRFQLLEGASIAELMQNQFCARNNITPFSSLFDIIDKDLKKLIEVKVTKDPEKAKEDYYIKSTGNHVNTALVIIDPDTHEINFENHPGDFNGIPKVRNFLTMRKMKMDQLEIMESTSTADEISVNKIFPNDYINNMVYEFIKHIRINIRDKQFSPPNIDSPNEGLPPRMYAKDMYNCLEDPSKRYDCPPVKWNGKLIPDFYCSTNFTKISTDRELVIEFTDEWGQEGNDFMKLIKQRIESIKSEIFNFSLYNQNEVRRKEVPDTVSKMLGIGAKKKYFDAGDNSTVQQETGYPPKLRYERWFNFTMMDMSLPTEDKGTSFSHLWERDQERPVHPMAKISRKASIKILQLYSKMNAARYASKTINFYSRLGGSYTNSRLKASKQGNVVIFPLYSNVKIEGEDQRNLTGIAVRAPHHATQPSDKIMFVTIERIDINKKTKIFWDANNDIGDLCEINGKLYLTRQNAINKNDTVYLTFINNSLFNAANMVGEICLVKCSGKPHIRVDNEIETFLETYQLWVCERITEGVIMAVCGSNQEEGLMSQLRKAVMAMMHKRRHGYAICWDLVKFCEGLNECCLNRPLAMYFQKSLHDIMWYMASRNEDSTLPDLS